MQKDNVIVSGNTVTILKSICELQQDDKLTIEIDQGDNIYDIIDQIDEDVSFQLKQILGYE